MLQNTNEYPWVLNSRAAHHVVAQSLVQILRVTFSLKLDPVRLFNFKLKLARCLLHVSEDILSQWHVASLANDDPLVAEEISWVRDRLPP